MPLSVSASMHETTPVSRNVTPLWAVHCTEYFDKLAPYCQAAMIAFMPPQVTAPVRIAIMVKFMREWCPTQTGSKLCAQTEKLEDPNFLELEEGEEEVADHGRGRQREGHTEGV